MSESESSPDFSIKLNGSKIPQEQAVAVKSIIIIEIIDSVSIFYIRMADDADRTLTDSSDWAEGTEVTIELGLKGDLTEVITGEITGIIPDFVKNSDDVITFDGVDGVQSRFESNNVDNFKNRIQGFIDAESALMGAAAFRPYTTLRQALINGGNDLTGDDIEDNTCCLLLVITDGEGSGSRGEEIQAAVNQLPQGDWKNVIELVSYSLFPNRERKNFHTFRSTNWTVAPHDVNTKDELDTLFDSLKVKYQLG